MTGPAATIRAEAVRRSVLRVIGAALLTLPLAALSRVPWTPPGAEEALLRLSWRSTVRGLEQCRDRTQEELAALPAHMRSPHVCEPDRSSYVLVTRVDDAPEDTVHLVRGGVKGDRPLFVLEERRLEPGTHRIRVVLLRVDGGNATPLMPVLDTTVALVAGRVALVTTDDDGATLTVR